MAKTMATLMTARMVDLFDEWGLWWRSNKTHYDTRGGRDPTMAPSRSVGQHSDPTLALCQQIEAKHHGRALVVDQVYRGLSQPLRMIVYLKHVEKMSNAEVCEELGITPDACRGRYKRAVAELRAEVLGRKLSRRA